MVLEVVLANMGISLVDFIVLLNKDKKTTSNLIKKYESYDYLVINKSKLRSTLWEEIFKIYSKKDIEKDDVKLFYMMTILPITNVMFLYNCIIKNEELDKPFSLCLDYCLDDRIVKKLMEKEIIKDDDFFEDTKTLSYRKKD